jgi:hypothetical protein
MNHLHKLSSTKFTISFNTQGERLVIMSVQKQNRTISLKVFLRQLMRYLSLALPAGAVVCLIMHKSVYLKMYKSAGVMCLTEEATLEVATMVASHLGTVQVDSFMITYANSSQYHSLSCIARIHY